MPIVIIELKEEVMRITINWWEDFIKRENFKEVTKKEIKQLEKYINEYRQKLFGEKNSKKYLT